MSAELVVFFVKGLQCVMDLEDYQRFKRNGTSFLIDRDGYLCTRNRDHARASGRSMGSNISIARLIMGAWPGELVDHKNRNRLDNSRDNLRLASREQNSWNAEHRRGKLGYYGVRKSPYSKTNPHQAFVKVRKTIKSVGHFKTAEAAAIARDEYVLRQRGEFAMLNFDPSRYKV